jgi:alpha-galactosidase
MTMNGVTFGIVVALPATLVTVVAAPLAEGQAWLDRLLAMPRTNGAPSALALQLIRQDYEKLERGQSVIGTPLTIGSRRYAHGLGTHSLSHIRLLAPEPINRFSAWVGVDNNERTAGNRGSVWFAVVADGAELYRSPTLRAGQEPEPVDLAVHGATVLDLLVGDAGDGPGWDHADWAEANVRTRSGRTVLLDSLPLRPPPFPGSPFPFSFTYDGRSSSERLANWRGEAATNRIDAQRRRLTWSWTDPNTHLRVEAELIRYADFPAADWVLYFENTGPTDTPILENIQALDLTLDRPLGSDELYRLHRTRGAPSDPTDFEPATVALKRGVTERLSAGGGRSSNRDFPFFKVEAGLGSLIVAIGWSGQWQAAFASPDGHHLRLTAGLEQTHFRLRPGERVRSPRMLVLGWPGESWESNAQFRQLIYRHYAAPRSGEPPLPVPFCNTCFTRGGGWLNECNAANQISLIRAYGPLGIEALITDAGWFEGGWPAGAGNWTPRREAYPAGMGPVAQAAKDQGLSYGLWFEPERVVAGTGLHRQHPDWVLTDGAAGQRTFLADFGRREVQDYFFDIVKGFMGLPGFRVYRQDFNLDPLAYWRHHDAPDRRGLTEIKYLEGLYAYWDRLAAAWPDSLREECASGGRRMDLETIKRFHLHQKSDYWFDSETDQASIWGLSQYLPNHLFDVPLTRLDDYSFHSTLASSLCLGWIADAPDFDAARARQLVARYQAVRPLLIGAWYPLLPYSPRPADWMASQYHRPDLDAGLILVFRRAQSPYHTAEVVLRGLRPEAIYELAHDTAGASSQHVGADLMRRLLITLPDRHRSELITYRRLPE